MVCLCVLVLTAGCPLDIFGVALAPTKSETEIPAEYNLLRAEQKILVLVDQPAWVEFSFNLRHYLTRAFNSAMSRTLSINEKYLIAYEELSAVRSNDREFTSFKPVKAGKKLDADLVLAITVNDGFLKKVPYSGNVKGYLNYSAKLFDVSSGVKVWPLNEESRNLKVGFEFETGGIEVAVARLTSSAAKGVIRYFYDCPYINFKLADESIFNGFEF